MLQCSWRGVYPILQYLPNQGNVDLRDLLELRWAAFQVISKEAQSGVGPCEQLGDVGGPVQVLSYCYAQIFCTLHFRYWLAVNCVDSGDLASAPVQFQFTQSDCVPQITWRSEDGDLVPTSAHVLVFLGIEAHPPLCTPFS